MGLLMRFTIRRVLAIIAGYLAVVIVTSLLTAAPAQAASRWAGYDLPANGYADGSWIGGRRLAGGAKVYRISPRKADVKTRYRKPTLISNLGGQGGPSRRRTARAAWILSKYGAYSDNIQSAAVDAATYHLLVGGKWRVGKRQGKGRLRQSGHSRDIRAYAKTMLEGSATSAGPFTRTLTASSTTVGSGIRATFSIRSSRTEAPLTGVPVTFSYPGAAEQTTYTNRAGVAVGLFTAIAGAGTISAKVKRVPEWRLHMRTARKSRGSNVVLAGMKASLASEATINGVDFQTVDVTNAASTVEVGSALTGSYSVEGGIGSREITQSLRGPFSTAATSCSFPTAYTSTLETTANGVLPLPSPVATQSGYYRWEVAAGGNPQILSASACGSNVKVQKSATITHAAPNSQDSEVALGEDFSVVATVDGFDRDETHTVSAVLYGPFDLETDADCLPNKVVTNKIQTSTITTNGSYPMDPVRITDASEAGWYIWKTTLSDGTLIIGDSAGCGVPVRVVLP